MTSPILSLIKLPPYSPELNPIEQVWSWLRQHVLANRSFQSYGDIADACIGLEALYCRCRSGLMSLCSRGWIKLT